MIHYVLILTMTGSFGGSVATATFEDLAACMKAGEIYLEMSPSKYSLLDYRCVKGKTE